MDRFQLLATKCEVKGTVKKNVEENRIEQNLALSLN